MVWRQHVWRSVFASASLAEIQVAIAFVWSCISLRCVSTVGWRGLLWLKALQWPALLPPYSPAARMSLTPAMDGLVADDQSCPLKCTGDTAKQIESNLMPCPDADVPGLGESMDGCDAPQDGDEAAILLDIGGGLSCRESGALGYYKFKYKSANTVGAAARKLVRQAGGTAEDARRAAAFAQQQWRATGGATGGTGLPVKAFKYANAESAARGASRREKRQGGTAEQARGAAAWVRCQWVPGAKCAPERAPGPKRWMTSHGRKWYPKEWDQWLYHPSGCLTGTCQHHLRARPAMKGRLCAWHRIQLQ